MRAQAETLAPLAIICSTASTRRLPAPIRSNTTPATTAPFEQVFRPYFDQTTASIPGCDLVVLLTGDETYPPTHISKYKPATDDPAHNLAFARDKRFHRANRMLHRTCTDSGEFLFQPYA